MNEDELYALLDRARSGDQAAVAVLQALVRDYRGVDRSLYSRALNQAAVFAGPSLEEPLPAALGDEEYDCQAWAAMGCAAMGFQSAVPMLVGLLDHPQWIVREEAVAALGHLGDSSVVPAMRPLLGDPREPLRQRAAARSDRGQEGAAYTWAHQGASGVIRYRVRSPAQGEARATPAWSRYSAARSS